MQHWLMYALAEQYMIKVTAIDKQGKSTYDHSKTEELSSLFAYEKSIGPSNFHSLNDAEEYANVMVKVFPRTRFLISENDIPLIEIENKEYWLLKENSDQTKNIWKNIRLHAIYLIFNGFLFLIGVLHTYF